MVLGTIADTLTRGVENVTGTVSEAFFEPVIRLGVTGLARSGKTVFITSLVANLMDRARMPGLVAAADGRIATAYLQPQPDDTVPRFDYENHLAALTARTPHWPDSTRTISELRLSLRVRPSGLLAGFQGPRTVHLDIIDYPGEWLLDLALLDKSYAEWSVETLTRLDTRGRRSCRPRGPKTARPRWRRGAPRRWRAASPTISRRRARPDFPTSRPDASCCPGTWPDRPS